ncbi:MAG: AAA family ATPase [Candidatus Pelagibacter sp.]|nr:AAA family ATPase [Candidatus Pelagibacter sp.]
MLKLMDLISEDLLKESVFDKSILKCVFMAGGPGSGKSYVASEIFGIPGNHTVTTKHDLKVVNSDTEFEHLLTKYGFDTAGWETLDIDQWPDDVLMVATGEDSKGNKLDPEVLSVREKAKGLTKKRLKGYTEGRLGVIIDGTGHDFSKINTQKKEMEHMGYDCYMVVVNTSLDVAKQRNSTRKRALPEDILEKSWKAVQNNLGKFQTLFRSNFKIVDNSKFLKPKQAQAKFKKIMGDGIDSFIKNPVKNPIGKTWIKNQKKLVKNKKRFN